MSLCNDPKCPYCPAYARSTELCDHDPDVQCGHCRPPEEGENTCWVSDDEYPWPDESEKQGLPSYSMFTGREVGREDVPDFFAGTVFKGNVTHNQHGHKFGGFTPRTEVSQVNPSGFDLYNVDFAEAERQVAAAMTGKREKLPLELIPFEALEDVVPAYQVGVGKYGRNSWREGMPYSVCASALLRHFSKWQRGEDHDPDGQHHVAAIAFYALAILQYERDGRTDLDDRYRRNNG